MPLIYDIPTSDDLEHDDEGHYVDRPGTIKTWTGKRVDPLDMRAEDIRISDIAHALARLCRYNGHCGGFLSVARHSLWVSDKLAELGPEMALWGLLHDAPEAYIGDMLSPLKHQDAMEPFRFADSQIEAAIAGAFNLEWPMPPEVHAADKAVFHEIERHDARYNWYGNYEDDEQEFLVRFEELTDAIATRKFAAALPRLVGLTGVARSGKDTVGEILVRRLGYERVSFADKLRAVAIGTDPYVALEDPAWNVSYARLSTVVESLGWEQAKEHADVRRLLQRLGTDGVRDNLGYDTWVDAATADLLDHKRYVFTDVRFENEACAVRDEGGEVWRVVRPGFEPVNGHISDSGLEAWLIDRTITNDGTLGNLEARVLQALQEETNQ